MHNFKNIPSVFFVGAGPGDPDLITVRGRDIVQRADLVLYAGSLVPRAVVSSAKPGAAVVDSAGLDLHQTHALMRETVLRGGMVARVHTGDPSLFGSLREQIRLLDKDDIAFAIIPGVTAAFATAARAAVSFTVPEHTQTLIITRTEGRTPMPEQEQLRYLARHNTSMAIYLSAEKTSVLIRELRLAGLSENTPLVVGHKIGHPEEQLRHCRLADLDATVRANGFTRQTMFLVLPDEHAPATKSHLYAPAFGHGFRPPRRPETWDRLAVYALTTAGRKLAERIAADHAADVFVPERLSTPATQGFCRMADQVRRNFTNYHGHVFITATGIAVRAIAPLLDNKTTDPAVLVCDQHGLHVISLLSGHLGGANELARTLAKSINATPIITTATDSEGVPALDTLAQTHGLAIANPKRIRAVNTCLAEGLPVSVHDPEHRLPLDHELLHRIDDAQKAMVLVSWRAIQTLPANHALILHPPCLVAGIGCRRGTTAHDILAALNFVFERHGLCPRSLAFLRSVDLKEDEPGLREAAEILGIPLVFVSRDELATIQVPNPSVTVRSKIGVDSVCEAAVLSTATRLLVPKTIRTTVTVAVGLVD